MRKTKSVAGRGQTGPAAKTAAKTMAKTAAKTATKTAAKDRAGTGTAAARRNRTVPPVAIIMGSQSDWATMSHAAETLGRSSASATRR